MPKIEVHSKYPDPDSGPAESRVRVGWTPGREHVEVATLAQDGQVLQPGPEANGWFVQLDRTGINDLIRGLRQARDKAYGRDE